jgi:hypothetical protein
VAWSDPVRKSETGKRAETSGGSDARLFVCLCHPFLQQLLLLQLLSRKPDVNSSKQLQFIES